MSPTKILLLILLVYCVTVTSARAAIDCEAIKPNTGTDRSIEDNFKGQAQILFKSLGSGEIENGYRKVESDALSKYPHADQLLLWRSYLYVTCTLLASSTQWTDDQKFQKLKELITLSIGPPPTPPVPQPPPPQVTPSPKLQTAAYMTNHSTALRKTPNHYSDIIEDVQAGVVVTILNTRNDGWMWVRDEQTGTEGYLHKTEIEEVR